MINAGIVKAAWKQLSISGSAPVVKTFWFKLFDVILFNREININLNDVEVLLEGCRK